MIRARIFIHRLPLMRLREAPCHPPGAGAATASLPPLTVFSLGCNRLSLPMRVTESAAPAATGAGRAREVRRGCPKTEDRKPWPKPSGLYRETPLETDTENLHARTF